MEALYDAIYVKWLASDLTDDFTNLYNTEADDKVVDPYAVVQLVVGSAIDYATNENFTDDWLVQFNLFDRSKDIADLWAGYATLTATFDSTTLVVAGYKFLSCRRPPGSTLQTREEGVWQINVSYNIRVRKT